MLLLVAPAEHKVRIEVGYGLEGTLTDALSSVIIASAIVPRFKANDFSGGIERGVDGIISVLTGDTSRVAAEGEGPRAKIRQAIFDKLFPSSVLRVADLHHVRYLIRQRQRYAVRPHVGRGGRMVFVPYSGSAWGSGWLLGRRRLVRRRLWRRIFRRRRIVRRRRRLGELVMPITPEDHAADRGRDPRQRRQRTSGQIVCVLAHASSDYAHVPIIWASVAGADCAMAADLFHAMERAADFPRPARRLHRRRAGLLLDAAALALVPRAVRRARAHRAALEQFVAARRRPHQQSHRRADFRVAGRALRAHHRRRGHRRERCTQAEWQAAVDALTGHMREGRIAPGFIAAIERCGAVLAAHAPPDGSANELPDRLYVM